MKKIGGSFPYINLPSEENQYLKNLTPQCGDLKYLCPECHIIVANSGVECLDILKKEENKVFTLTKRLLIFDFCGKISSQSKGNTIIRSYKIF